MTVELSSERPEARHGRYAEYTPCELPLLGEIPSHWNVTRNSAIFRDRREKRHQHLPVFSVTQARGVIPQEEVKIKVVRPSDNRDGYNRILPGDLVYNKMRMWQGAVGTATSEGIVSPAYVVCAPVRPVVTRYFEYLYRTPVFVSESGRWSYGICDDMNSLRWSDFKRIRSPEPPLAEQRAIADFLDRETARIDVLVDKKQRLLELLEEKRTALVTCAVTKGLDPDVETKESGVEWLGEIPAHWEIPRLMYLTDATRPIMYGIVLPGPSVAEGVPLVKGGDVKQDRLATDSLNRVAAEIESRHARSRLQGGDLVYAIRGSIGDVEIVPDELDGANLTQDAARISVRDGMDAKWLAFALRSRACFAQLEAGALGATIRGINIRDLKRVRLPVPPTAEQKRIARFLRQRTADLHLLSDRIRRAITLLREYRTALISVAVTGKIDVRRAA